MEQEIGRCEGCGIVDHHLIEGLCEQCDHKVIRHADPSLDEDGYGNVPLGVEAGCPVLAVDGKPQGINVEKLSYLMPSLRRFIGG
ncbi:MAG: hypothetical protein OEZ16_07075 [Chromatiales bacterium]|nr:hypothetical protein [Chromatiales bacterium]